MLMVFLVFGCFMFVEVKLLVDVMCSIVFWYDDLFVFEVICDWFEYVYWKVGVNLG